MKKISIVFPIYNEQVRLNKLFNSLENFNKTKNKFFFEIIFVNDGSTDDSKEKITKFIKNLSKGKNTFKLVNSEKNFGKGYALKLGIKNAKYNWILTIDSDLSVTLDQLLQWIKDYKFKDNYAYFGSRNHPKSKIKYKYYRKIIGNILQTLVFVFIDKDIKDTQCGFKLYNSKYVKRIFNRLKEDGFAHDIELIFLLKKAGIKIQELPIKWKHVGNSKLNPFFESISFFFKFFLLVLKYKFY
jgi:dolichyl-phosphate beta-glucosyltransferase